MEVESPSPRASSPTAATGALRGAGPKIAATIFGALMLFIGFSLYADVSKLRENLENYDWRTFVFALILATGNYALRFVRWQYYLRRIGYHVPNRESALVFLSAFVMSITPGKVGEVYKSWLLHESRQIPIAHTAPIVIAERLTDLVGIVALIAIGAVTFPNGFLIAIGSAVTVGFILLMCTVQPVGRFAIRVTERLPLVKRVAPKLREALLSLYELTGARALWIGSSISFAAWALECLGLWIILKGFGIDSIGVLDSVFVYATSTIAGALALMPGGLGVTEAGMAGLLRSIGNPPISETIAIASTLLVRLATLWWAVALGAIALTVWRKTGRLAMINTRESS